MEKENFVECLSDSSGDKGCSRFLIVVELDQHPSQFPLDLPASHGCRLLRLKTATMESHSSVRWEPSRAPRVSQHAKKVAVCIWSFDSGLVMGLMVGARITPPSIDSCESVFWHAGHRLIPTRNELLTHSSWTQQPASQRTLQVSCYANVSDHTTQMLL